MQDFNNRLAHDIIRQKHEMDNFLSGCRIGIDNFMDAVDNFDRCLSSANNSEEGFVRDILYDAIYILDDIPPKYDSLVTDILSNPLFSTMVTLVDEEADTKTLLKCLGVTFKCTLCERIL